MSKRRTRCGNFTMCTRKTGILRCRRSFQVAVVHGFSRCLVVPRGSYLTVTGRAIKSRGTTYSRSHPIRDIVFGTSLKLGIPSRLLVTVRSRVIRRFAVSV